MSAAVSMRVSSVLIVEKAFTADMAHSPSIKIFVILYYSYELLSNEISGLLGYNSIHPGSRTRKGADCNDDQE